jgi:hypothetical protein
MSASVTAMLVEKLNGIFGTFVTGISAENLTVSLFQGTLVQENLSLKPEALLGLRKFTGAYCVACGSWVYAEQSASVLQGCR